MKRFLYPLLLITLTAGMGCASVRKFIANPTVKTIAPILTTASCAELKAKGNPADVAAVKAALAACQKGLE